MTNVFTCLMKKKFGNGNGSGLDRDCIGNGPAKSRKLFAVLLLLTVGVVQMWGGTASLTFTAKCSGSGLATDGVTSWTITSDADESTYESARGIHYGTGSAAVSYINLSTSSISGTITKIVVNASGGTSTTGTVSVTVGGSDFGGDAQSISSTATEYTFNGSASGTIVISISQTSTQRALYCKSVTVSFTRTDGSLRDVMFAKGFADYTTNSYSKVGTDYSAVANSNDETSVNYAMQVFNGSTGQVKGSSSGAENYSCRNTTTKAGYYISQISMTVTGGTLDGSTSGRSVVYFGSSAYDDPNTTAPTGDYTNPSPTSNGQTTLTWINTDPDVSYFILYDLKTASNPKTNSSTEALVVTWTPLECTSYSFHSKNSSSVWDTQFCFSQVGSNTLYRTEEIYLPSDGVSFKVGWKGADNAAKAKTSETAWQYMVAGPSTTRSGGGYWSIGNHISAGNTGGAKGYFYVYSDSEVNNKYVGFTPSGYVLRWGKDGDGWTSKVFTAKSSDIDETEWNTGVQSWTSDNADDYIYVGLETEDDYVWCSHSALKRPIYLRPNANWLQKDEESKDCKFAAYYYTSDETHTGWTDFLQDSDGDGVYEGWIPNDYDYAKVIFVRFLNRKASTGNWDDKYNQTSNLSLQSDKNVFELAAGKWGGDDGEGAWALYDKPGVFRIDASSTQQNWSCTFMPHYVLSYNANTGSGSMDDQSVAYDADSKSLTIAANGFTAPTGKYFTGWNTKADGSGADKSAGGSITLDRDTVLYAQWSNKPLTSISLSPESGTVYVGQYADFTVTYDPSDYLSKGYTISTPTYCKKEGSSTNVLLRISGGRAGATVTTDQTETITVTSSGDDTKSASIEITTKPLPKVHFKDLVHGETFSDVVATIEANAFVKDQDMPTHDDWTTPNTNTCESEHLVLKGWIDSEWSSVATYLAGGSAPSKSDITSATGYYFAAGSSIDVDANDGKTYYAVWGNAEDDEYIFSCSEIELEVKLVTTGTPIFITSAASQKVRSQDSILITGSGLTPSTALTFPGLNSKFTVKTRSNGALSTDASGAIDAVAYIFYTPDAEDTSDGLDKITSLTVSVGGDKPKQVTLAQNIIGRHLPANFVIAAKKDHKWWAVPSDMSSTTKPEPEEIAVDDNDNPTIAYTESTTIYGLVGPTSSNISGSKGQYIRFKMSISDGNDPSGPAPLFGTTSTDIGKSGNSKITSDLSAGYWWELKQTATSITNPEDAKYAVKTPNNSNTLTLSNGQGKWGLYSTTSKDVDEIRLIPASATSYTEAEVVAWGQKNLIVEVDKPTIGATQVRAKLNGSYSTKKSLSTTTGTSVKGTSTRYNYTLDFTDEFDFGNKDNKEKILLFEWLDGSDNLLYVSSVALPLIISADHNMSWYGDTKGYWKDLEVHVLPGVTLTANTASIPDSTSINELHIYPGATLNIASGKNARTLKIATLIMRNGWNRLTGEKSYDVARVYIKPYEDESNNASSLVATNAYTDWYIDYDQYYPVAVPWEVTTSGMTYLNTNGTAASGVMMRYYDGASRAANVQEGVGSGANWKEYSEGGNAYPATLTPGEGYIMTARRPAGKAFSIVRMPMTIPSAAWTRSGEQGSVEDTHKDQVSVTAHGTVSTPSYAKGWNLIANPYMSLHQGELNYTDEGEIEYANIPNTDFTEYDQVAIETTKLKPSSAFLVQAPKTGTVTFGTANRKASAPSYRKEAQQTATKQKAYILLNNDVSSDMMGLLVSEDYTDEYEINADLQKLLGNGTSLRTYMYYGDMEMAYLAINETSAKEWIPVSVRIPADGEYTYSLHNASRIDELEGIYLQDYNTGQIINLIEENYTFSAEAGTINNRFAINSQKGSRETPTDIDIVQASGETDISKPIKFLYRNKVYILYENALYDATGKRVKTINK